MINIKDNKKNKIYLVEVLIDNIASGKGSGYSIKAAEQNAAQEAIMKMHID